jgi:hypothetical protein
MEWAILNGSVRVDALADLTFVTRQIPYRRLGTVAETGIVRPRYSNCAGLRPCLH